MVAPDRQRLRAMMLRRAGIAGAPAPGAAEAAPPSAEAPTAAAPPGDAIARSAPSIAERVTPAPAGHRSPDAALRDLLQRRLAAPRPRDAVELPPGETLHNERGACWRRVLRYDCGHRHGDVALHGARSLDRERLASIAREERCRSLRLSDCLFVDTETTGLAGGAGTVVFTIGLGWFEDRGDAAGAAGDFVFEQLFLRDFGEEPAMLEQLAVRLHEHPVPVTFVGKSFDRHRLAARLAVHRMEAPILCDLHLDLYHVSRRVWGRELPDCRLRTVEERRLGLFRTDDLPGSEAPMAFLCWLRDRCGPVDRVLEHNRLDVLSVAALLGQLAGGPGR